MFLYNLNPFPNLRRNFFTFAIAFVLDGQSRLPRLLEEKDINSKDSDTYVVEDNKIIDILDNKINDININNEIKYVYTYLEDTKNYYVFIAYGTYEDVQGKRIIYSDLDKNNIYKELNIKDTFIIDDSNYDDFGKYKITFIKDGDNSYFKSLERLE